MVVNPSNSTVPYWSNYGPNNDKGNFLGLNPYLIGSHVAPIQMQENSDKISEAKLDATWHEGSTKVNFGFEYLDDTWNSKEYDTFTNNEWQLWSGYGPASNNFVYYCGATACTDQNNPGAGATKVVHGVSLPSSYFTAVSLPNFLPGLQRQRQSAPGTAPLQSVHGAELPDDTADQRRLEPEYRVSDVLGRPADAGAEHHQRAARGSGQLRALRDRGAQFPHRRTCR